MHTTFWLENLKGRDHLKNLGLEGRMILEWILVNGVEKCGLDASSSG